MHPLAHALDSELTLLEYGTSSSLIRGAELYERPQCLQAYLTNNWLTRSYAGEQPCLRASHFVGILPFADGDQKRLLLISPKGCRKNQNLGLIRFLELIALSEGEKPPEIPAGFQGLRGPSKFLLIFAYHYAELLRELCLRDFRSYYRPEEDELRSRIRGRLDLARYSRLAVRGKAHILPCRWDDFTVDNWDNRILWYAARRLKQVAGALDSQAAELVWQPFKRLLPWFSGVAEVQITTHDFRKSRLWRTSRYYRRALTWAEMLIRGSERPLSGGQAPPLVLDANRAFEKFAQVIARDAATEFMWRVKSKPLSFLTGDMNQGREPDILVSDPDGKHSVGDAKYKDVLERSQDELLDSGEKVLGVCINENDWNQLYVYVGISRASFGFFVVPFWQAEGDEIYWNPDIQFAIPPVEGSVQLAVLGLNLLKPLTEVKKKAALQLRNWLEH